MARQAVSATAPVYRILGQTFDLPAAELGIAWSTLPGTRTAMRFHSLPTFSSSVKGMLTAQATDGRLCLAWAGAEPEGGAATLLDRVANALGAIRSEAHTSERQAQMRTSDAVFCFKKNIKEKNQS